MANVYGMMLNQKSILQILLFDEFFLFRFDGLQINLV
jgi:hypothetical protein